jgi:putative ABC transport system permease protein
MKSPAPIRAGLVREVIVMAFDTVRANKMRSGLTVLGVVIGITSIVAMTALIRGFDTSLQDSIRATMGPSTIFIQRFGFTSFASGREFSELIKRPNLTVSDARALEEQATTLAYVDIELGVGAGPTTQRRVTYRDQRTRPQLVFGTTEYFAEGTRIPVAAGRFRHRVSAALCRPRPRSDRKDRADRPRSIHGRRRVRQTPVAGQLQRQSG